MEKLAEVVSEAQKGDSIAFEKLVRDFRDMAVGYAYSILRDWQRAEDAAQEAFIEVHCHLNQLRAPLAFPSWLRRIVFKHCDRIMRRRCLPEVELPIASIVLEKHQLSCFLERQEMQEHLMKELESLSSEERIIFTLFYGSDYSHKEIAQFLELPLATVNNRLRSARLRIKEGMLEMAAENLQEKRPSYTDQFADRVLTFINAADSGYVDEVKTLLAENPELVDQKGKARYSTRDVRALHYALNYGHVEVVKELLDSGADIDAKADETWAPIHYALRGAHPELAHLLRERDAEIDVFAAAGLGDLSSVKEQVEARPEVVRQPGPGGATPLHFATSAKVADYLIAKGADVNANDRRGRTPLTWAANHKDVVNVLLNHGAEVADIFMACALGHVDKVRGLLDEDPARLHAHKDPRTGTPLHVAADKGQLAVAKLVVERGAAVNALTDSGDITPMHDAAFSGHIEMVEWLLEQGADPAARDTEFGATPLAWARFNGRNEVAAILERAK